MHFTYKEYIYILHTKNTDALDMHQIHINCTCIECTSNAYIKILTLYINKMHIHCTYIKYKYIVHASETHTLYMHQIHINCTSLNVHALCIHQIHIHCT